MNEPSKCDHCNEAVDDGHCVTRTYPTGSMAGRTTGRSVKIHNLCDLPWLRAAQRDIRSRIDIEIVKAGGSPPISRGIPYSMDEVGESASIEEALPVLRAQLVAAKAVTERIIASRAV